MNILWLTFSRVDLLDEEILVLMKQAGCHTLVLGIESGSDTMLKQYRKGYDKKQIVATMNICKKLRIRTVGTFIIGLPEETEQTATETLEFIKSLPLDYASFNVAVPRPGTDLRTEALANKLIEENDIIMDQSGTEVAMPTKNLSQEQVKKIRQKMVREFYLRPGYVFRRVVTTRTWYELYQNVVNALILIRRTWGV